MAALAIDDGEDDEDGIQYETAKQVDGSAYGHILVAMQRGVFKMCCSSSFLQVCLISQAPTFLKTVSILDLTLEQTNLDNKIHKSNR